jgi:diaminopimelate decarboxylase
VNEEIRTEPVVCVEPAWWLRPGLDARDGRLRVAGRDAEQLARAYGTPLLAYDLSHVRERLLELRGAFARAGLRHRLRVALKAQRSPEYLAVVRSLGAPGSAEAVGLDACSPGEVDCGLANGFLPSEISVTGTNFLDRDLAHMLDAGVHMNADLVSQLERIGRLAPGSSVGLRVNPRLGAVNRRSGSTMYSGTRPTKFGLYADDLGRALEVAARHGLVVDTVDFHVANGMLDEDLEAFGHATAAVAEMVATLLEAGCPIAEINAGGGLGVAYRPGEQPLDLDAYVGVLGERLAGFGVPISCEPGEWVSTLAGVLLAEVATVEERLGRRFVGLNVGWNVVNYRMVYDLDVPVIHATAADAPPARLVTFSGNINEGPDLFIEDFPFPEVKEDDVVALYGVGAYTLTCYHPHCLRPPAAAVFFTDRI